MTASSAWPDRHGAAVAFPDDVVGGSPSSPGPPCSLAAGLAAHAAAGPKPTGREVDMPNHVHLVRHARGRLDG